MQVLKTIDWEAINIEVILVELIHAGKVFNGNREEVIHFLEKQNYQFIGNIFDDVFVRKDLIGTKYDIDIKTVQERYPLFSSDRGIVKADKVEL